MQPLQRQETRSSLYSWWSDSNPMLVLTGPTFNLHAMAKPLMRFMYHRQALGFVEKNRDAPLSAELLEIYSSYLSCKYVSRRTRQLILDHLRLRASSSFSRGRDTDHSGPDAQEIICSPLLNQILFIPDASVPESSRLINALIAALVVSNSNFSTYWDHEIYFQAFDFDLPETEAAICEVMHVLRNQKGPAAIQALLESANASVIRFTLRLITELDPDTLWPDNRWMKKFEVPEPRQASYIYNIISSGNWPNLSSNENVSPVHIGSISGLSEIADHPGGSRAIIAAKILDKLQHSFDSEISSPRGWAWPLIRSLAKHDFAIPHILHANVIDKLVYHTSCPSEYAWERSYDALSALTAVSMHPEGAAAVLAAMSEMDFFNLAASLDKDYHLIPQVCRLISTLAAKDRNGASVLLRSSHLIPALESILRFESSADPLAFLYFLDAASTLIQLHKWSGPEKLGNIIAVMRQGAATAKVSLEDIPKFLDPEVFLVWKTQLSVHSIATVSPGTLLFRTAEQPG